MQRYFSYLILSLFIFFMPVMPSLADTKILPAADREAIALVVAKDVANRLKVESARVRLALQLVKHEDDWVFISADINGEKNQPFDYVGTDLYEGAQAGILRNSVEALLQRQGTDWKLVDIIMNAGDVAWDGWAERYQAPKGIFEIVCLRPSEPECKELREAKDLRKAKEPREVRILDEVSVPKKEH